MVRGTTAKFKFDLPCTKNELLWATIKFWQPGNDGTSQAPLPIIKKLSHCGAPDGATYLYVSLSAEETSRFSDRLKAKAQFRAQRSDGTVFGSRQKIVTVYPSDAILDDELILPEVEEDGFIILDGQNIIS